jgi:hypothetical protein
VPFNEELKRRQFVELYHNRKPDETPQLIMDQIGAPRRMLAQWIADSDFRDELDKIDGLRVWLAKEVFFRKIGDVFETVANLASQRGANSLRAAEVMVKIVGVVREPRAVPATPQGQEAEKSQGSTTLDELVRQRTEIMEVLKSVGGGPADDAEAVSGAGSGDPEKDAD